MLDAVRSRPPKFNPEEVTAQYCELLKSYGISKVCGDKFSGDWALNAFAKHGIAYERAEKSKSELYLEGEGAFNTERVDLPNRQSLVMQLKALVRKTRSGGRDSVDTDSGQPEDEANVCAGLIDLLMNRDASDVYIGLSDGPVYGPGSEIDVDFNPWAIDLGPKHDFSAPPKENTRALTTNKIQPRSWKK